MTLSSTCLHFGVCGGCSSQNISYSDQLKGKEEIVFSLFPNDHDKIATIYTCDHPWRYRNKMEFSFSEAKTGQRFLGLMQRKGRGRVENLQECLISPSWFSELLGVVRKWQERWNLNAYYPPLNGDFYGHLPYEKECAPKKKW